LVLVAATFVAGDAVTLTFDRAIDASGVVGSAIVVDDGGDTGYRFRANGYVTMIDPQTARLEVVDVEPTSSTTTTLDASAGNGIVAVEDGGAWPGVVGLALPFP
jgi:hypothetical protein